MSNWAKLQEDLTGLQVVKRAKHGIHFDKGDGSILANFAGKPCHYLDGATWKAIDTKLLALGDGYYGCPHSKVKVHPNGTVAVAGTDYAQRVELPSAQTGLLDGDKLIRKFSFGEQRMWVTEDGFRSEIQLNRIPTLTEAKKLIASESGALSKEYLKSFTTATDANGDGHTVTTLSAFRTWLAGATFPVVIDPDFSIGSGGIFCSRSYSNVSADAAHSATGGRGWNPYCGYELDGGVNHRWYRFGFRFDTSSIGGSSTVTQVNLKIYGLYNANAQVTLITKYDWSAYYPFDTSTGNYAAVHAGIIGATAESGYFNDWKDGGWGTSQNLSTDWVSKTGATYYGFISTYDYNWNGTDTGIFKGVGTGANAPVLTVTYTAGGALLNVNMNGQMQNLTGGMRG